MRLHALFLSTALVLVTAATHAGDAKKGDNLNGTWLPVSSTLNGKALGDDILKKSQLVIEDEKFTVHVNDKTIKGTFKTDPSKTPRTLDAKYKDDSGKEVTLLAIYELKGDMMTVCTGEPGKDRPKEFESKAGSGHELTVYKRKK